MSVLAIMDAETGSTNEWQWKYNNGGVFSASTQSKYAGTYGWDCANDGVGGDLGGGKSFTASDDVYVHFWFKMSSSFPMANDGTFLLVKANSGGTVLTHLAIIANASGVPTTWGLGYRLGEETSTQNFALDTWIEVELRSLIGTGANSVHQIWIDGDLLMDKSDGDSVWQQNRVFQGIFNSSDVNDGALLFMDEVEVNTERVGGAAGVDIPIDVGALTLAGFALTVALTANIIIAPDVGAVDLVGYAPTVVLDNNTNIDIDVGAVDLTGFALTAALTGHVIATPDVGSLDLAGFALTAVATADELFIIDAEGNDLSEWTSDFQTNGNFVANTASKRSGTYGFETASTGGIPSCGGYKSWTSVDEAYVRFFIKINTGFLMDADEIITFCEFKSAGPFTYLYIKAGGDGIPYTWQYETWGGSRTDFSTGFALNEWIEIELRGVKGTGSDGIHQVWVNDTLVLDRTDGTLTDQLQEVYIGMFGGAAIDSGSKWYLDDIEGNTTRIGGGAAVDINLDVGAIDLVGFALTAVATNDIDIPIGVGSLSFTGYALTVVAGNNIDINIGYGVFALNGFALTVITDDNIEALPDTGVLALTGFELTVVTPKTVALDVGGLTLTGFAPAITVDNNIDINIGYGVFALNGFALTVVTTSDALISLDVGALTLTGYALTVDDGAVAITSPPTVVIVETSVEFEKIKSRFDIITNGTFDTDLTDWVVESSGWEWSSGKVLYNNTINGEALYQPDKCIVGEYYNVQFDVEVISGIANFQVYGLPFPGDAGYRTWDAGHYDFTTQQLTTTELRLIGRAFGEFTIDNIVVTHVGISDVSVAIAETQNYVDNNVIIGGTFDDNFTGWTKGGSPTSEVIDHDGHINAAHLTTTVSDTGYNQTSVSSGQIYIVTFDVKVIGGGVYLGKVDNKVGSRNFTDSIWTSYTYYWTANDNAFRFYNNIASSEFYIDNIIVSPIKASDVSVIITE